MSKTLISRTNKEFDQRSERLKTLLNVQESREDSKSPTTTRQANRKKQQQQSSANIRTKKQNSIKSSAMKTSKFIQKDTNSDNRSIHSPNKPSNFTVEESFSTKNRLSPTKIPNSSPRKIAHLSRQKSSPIKSINLEQDGLIRSSSCDHLSSSKSTFMFKSPPSTNVLFDQLISIRNLSKQIRTRTSNAQCSYLWNEFDKKLSSTLSYINNDIQLEVCLTPLKNELNELRKQLQNTNFHLNQYDQKRHQNDQYLQLQKQFETHQIQYKHLLLHNEQLKTKCYLLKDKLEYFERNNIRLIQRLTKQDLHSIAKRTDWILTDNRHRLREEILFLKEKLYHIYDDISILFNRNQNLEKSNDEQKQQIHFYKEQIKNFQETARDILNDLDQRIVEEKIRRFLNLLLLLEQNPNDISKNFSHLNQIKPSAFTFQIPKQSADVRIQTHASNTRPKSLFVTPNILNDSNVLSNLQNQRNSICIQLKNSPSTIDDADSTMTSSSVSSVQQHQLVHGNRTNSKTKKGYEQYFHNNESGQELDQISDLTSKMFTSGDEEDKHLSTSSSSSSFLSYDENLHHM